ncbi:MAG: ABC transporter ATP-binding protein [Pseudomonadota bacterium]
MDDDILTVQNVNKTYDSGHTALKDVSLSLHRGEILALLGPNGAGKTTLISIICGIVRATSGRVAVDGHDTVHQYRAARRMIGLVPQEIVLEPFESVYDTVRYSRGIFGARPNDAYIESLLKRLSLWDKKSAITKELSGGMKRRCLIAKALAHEPRILFLDEPTAGVDVELRKDMWDTVADLKTHGVTTILTTHYIEEAEAIADRIGVISDGRLLLVEEKASLMKRLGRRQVRLMLTAPVNTVPEALEKYGLELGPDNSLIYNYNEDEPQVAALLADLSAAGFTLRDVETQKRSLEEIFVELVRSANGDGA